MWPNEKLPISDPTQGPISGSNGDKNPIPPNGNKGLLPDYGTATASSSTAFQTHFASLSMHMEDRLRFLQFPPNIVEICRQTIKTIWMRGIQTERLYAGSQEIKLYGKPWRGHADEAIAARRLICRLLAALHGEGWVLTLSTDISKKNADKDTLLFRHQNPAPAECDWCCIGFSRSDRIRFIDVPAEVYNIFASKLPNNRLQSRGQHSPGVYEFKIYGRPWWADGTDTMIVRGMLLSLLEALEEEGWTVYASIDQKNSGENYTETDTVSEAYFHIQMMEN
ncbi:hypothetical protein CC78DRAFT_294841 [Lojkania enalia]|uniref:Uncharacterized protein n=1 Tax=Lojkania enalia TaxID=147567 RepID=A0A9P4K8C2_9PLEO|nr:hypothetical protein CC78DRAFT_294841 [Didymosphaeria enalia]